jgi:phage shock protein PspC (stress-responsive transcriptional regulator)
MNKDMKKLYRSRDHRIIGGVCGGIAEYFEVDPTLIRIIFLILSFGMGSGFLIYIVLLLIVPLEPVVGSEARLSSVDNLTEQAKTAVEKLASTAENAWAHKPEEKPENEHQRDGFRAIFGLVIIVLGLVALLSVFMPMPHVAWRVVWPVILVIFGLSIIAKN